MSDSWQQLDEIFFKQAHKLVEGKKVKLDPFKPRQHQQKALTEAGVATGINQNFIQYRIDFITD